MKDEALRLALEALEKLDKIMKRSPDTDKAITAIKQALAQPEQEPEAWMNPYGDVILFRVTRQEIKHYTIPLYASPPKREPEPEPVIDKSAAIRIATSLGWTPKREWQGLTEDEVSKLIDNEIGFNSCCGWEEEYTRAVEAKLKEKNT